MDKLVAFVNSPQKILVLPSLNRDQRREIHEYCDEHHLFSRSEGEGTNRTISVHKEVFKITVSDADRKQFVKDFNLHIPVWTEKYLPYFIDLYDMLFNTKAKYKLFLDAVDKLAKQGRTLGAYSEILATNIANAIKKTKVVINVGSRGVDPVAIPQTHIYVGDSSEERHFISLDLIKANFNVLKYYNPTMVFGAETWEELVHQFTDIEYFAVAKHFRQVVFGHVSHKQIAMLQRRLQSELYNALCNVGINVKGRLGDDEIIVETTKDNRTNLVNQIDDIVDSIPSAKLWRVTPFTVYKLGTKGTAYVREDIRSGEGHISFHNIEKDFYSQAYKYFLGVDVEPTDLKAIKDGRVVTYEEPYDFD